MNSDKTGTILKKNISNIPGKKIWMMKLAVAILVSNIFFFLLFSPSEGPIQSPSLPPGWVEVQVAAKLLTPFHSGKKVLLVHRSGRKKMEGVLQALRSDEAETLTIRVREEEAHTLFQHDGWEVLPYLRYLSFAATQREKHEIHY